jgi:hypothetical protein
MSRSRSPVSKVALASVLWVRYGYVRLVTGRRPLPAAIGTIGNVRQRSTGRTEPRHMGLIVGRVLRVGPWQPRCLFQALVLYRTLRAQGEPAELVIGLPEEASSKDAHAWVEIGGSDVGPPPGRGEHRELARYGGEPGRARSDRRARRTAR